MFAFFLVVAADIAELVSADYDELMEAVIKGNKHLNVLFFKYFRQEWLSKC